MKKFICGLMVVMMTTLNCLTGFAVTFTDINDVPWVGAETYINNAANAGLMVGEKNSKGQTIFRARSEVTYCEAVQLSYNLLKKTTGATTSATTITKWTGVLKSFNIPTWAYEAVAYGLENSIITTSDVVKFMKNSAKSNDATREDVAVMFGKVLAKTNTLNYAAKLTFGDSSQITSFSVAYIELLTRLNILVGDANNRFNPNNKINRAEMAVMTYKTYNHLILEQNLPLQTTGTVVGNVELLAGRHTITLLVNGQNKIFSVPSAVQVVNGSKIVAPSTIRVNDIIAITYKGNEVSQATITYDANVIVENKLEGIIKSIRTNKIEIETKELNVYAYGLDRVLVQLDNRTRDLDYLIDEYYDKDEISVVLTLDSKDNVRKIVAITEDDDKDSDADYEGELTYLTTSKLKLNGKSTYYKIDDEDEIEVDIEDGISETLSDFDDLKTAYDAGKVIEAKIYLDNDDYIVKIEGEVVEVKGYLYSIQTRYNTLKIKIGSKYYEYEYEDEYDVDIEIDGKYRDMDDLEDIAGDRLQVELVLEDGYIVEIYVGASFKAIYSDYQLDGKLAYISSSKLKVSTINSEYLIENENDVMVDVEDGIGASLTSISDLEDAFYEDKVIDVTIYIKEDYVIEIKGEVVGVSGKLSLVKTDGTIGIDTYSGYYTYECDDVVIDVDGADTLSELITQIRKKNTRVKLSLKNGYVVRIED